MLSLEQARHFEETDTAFIEMMRAVRDMDPLDSHGDDDWLAEFRQKGTPVEPDVMLDKFYEWQTTGADATAAESFAVRRDVDKVTGHLVATTRNAAEPAMDEVLRAVADMTDGNPRANVYDFTFGNHADTSGTYTGSEREVRTIEVFEGTLTDAHIALRALTHARAAIHTGETSANIAANLSQALHHVSAMRAQMRNVYRDIGPAFIAQELTRYVGGFATSMGKIEGPNPSHSGFLVLDRMAIGSFERLFEKQPFLRELFDYRIRDMPEHLRELLDAADQAEEDESIGQLTARIGGGAHESALEIVRELRKFKVVHKSYADKGLQAKGGILTDDEPDVLSESVTFVRQAEEA